MKRLIKGQGKNSPQEYDQIFQDRAKQEPNWQDLRRWNVLMRYFQGGKVVDIGCLDSLIYSEHINFDSTYLGTDLSKVAVDRMSKDYPFNNCAFIVDDIYKSKIKDEVADYVILGEVLEHLDLPRLAIKEAFRILKPGGILAISVPLEEANEPGAVDSERHVWSISKEDVKDLVKPYSSKVKFKVLRSKWFPYKYAWPTIVTYAWKK